MKFGESDGDIVGSTRTLITGSSSPLKKQLASKTLEEPFLAQAEADLTLQR